MSIIEPVSSGIADATLCSINGQDEEDARE